MATDDYRIFDGTNWVSPCNQEIKILSADGVTWELLDLVGRDVNYFDGLVWKPMTCSCVSCDVGFTLNPASGNCEQYVSPTFVGTPLVLQQGNQSVVYGEFGGYLYDSLGLITSPDYVLPIIISVLPYTLEDDILMPLSITTNIQNALWGITGQAITDGRLNKIGVWDGTTTPNHELSFTFCLNISVQKEYIIGLAADNATKLEIDIDSLGSFITAIDTSGGDGTTDQANFKRFHLFPVTLPVGNHKIKLTGINYGLISSFGAEIYDIDSATLASTLMGAGNVEADIEPYILFSTKNFIGVTIAEEGTMVGEYICPDGSTFNACLGVPLCVLTGTCI